MIRITTAISSVRGISSITTGTSLRKISRSYLQKDEMINNVRLGLEIFFYGCPCSLHFDYVKC